MSNLKLKFQQPCLKQDHHSRRNMEAAAECTLTRGMLQAC